MTELETRRFLRHGIRPEPARYTPQMTRLACWLSRDDNAFGVVVISMAPLIALVVIGMAGSGI
jgi:hypothetical protein